MEDNFGRRLADLITLTIVLVFFGLIYSLTEAIRNRRTNKNNSVLSRLGYDPDQHDLKVILAGGCTITGKADAFSDPLQHGVLLSDARESGGETLAGMITFIPAHSITGLTIRDRTDA